MLIAFRSGLFGIGYAVSTMLYGMLTPLLACLPRALRHKVLISWCWLIIEWLRWSCGVRYRIQGLDNIHKTPGPKVVLSKHQSTWETLMLQRLFWPVATILKKELLSIPFFGWGLRGMRPIAIDRDNPRNALRQVKEEGISRLREGLHVLVFPEGTRVLPGEKGKYARSGPDIAIAAGVDIVPVAVNAGHCWPVKTLKRYPGLVTVVIGEPIPTAGRTSRELIEQVENWIEQQMAQMPPSLDQP